MGRAVEALWGICNICCGLLAWGEACSFEGTSPSHCRCGQPFLQLYILIYFLYSGGEPDRRVLYEYIKKEVINGKSVSVCTMCGKSNSQKHNIVNHVESVHFPNMFTYSCKYCGKTYNAKNSLHVHISTSHREENSVY